MTAKAYLFYFFISFGSQHAWGLSSSLPSTLDSLAASAQRTLLGGLGQLWKSQEKDTIDYANAEDSEYPWKFTGRCIYVPALVKCDTVSLPNSDLVLLNLGGWTVGGTVVLEYDTSPVGYYREWVTLGGLAYYPRRTRENKSLLVGQFGSKLYVTKREAEVLCESVWGLVASRAEIRLLEEDGSNSISLQADDEGKLLALTASGWQNAKKTPGLPFKNLGLLWTPTIKAIWACLLKLPVGKTSDKEGSPNSDENSESLGVLPLNRLRLSGSVQPAFFNTISMPKDSPSTLPFGVGLSVEKLVIEISPSIADP